MRVFARGRVDGEALGRDRKAEHVLWLPGHTLWSMAGSAAVLLEPPLVGEQHRKIVDELLGRFSVDPGTGRWTLVPGLGGLVLLAGPAGAGKSRIVREFYRRLRASQSQPGYWPPLQPSGGVSAPDGRGGGVSVFGFRKSLGPDVGGMIWPPHSVPDYVWWHLTCQTSSTSGFLATDVLFAHQLLAHREPATLGWARAKGPHRWATRAPELVKRAAGAVVDEAADEFTAAVLAEVAGQAVPFGGLVTESLRSIAGFVRKTGDRQKRLDQDAPLGVATGGIEDPTDTLAGVINSLALPGFPVVVAIEDVHDADPGLLDLLRRLTGPAFTDRVLVVATGWPEALASRQIGGQPLREWLEGLGAEVAHVDVLRAEAVEELVREQFPTTEPDRLTAVASRWSNPLALALVLDLLVADGGSRGSAIVADDEQIAEIPTAMAGIYDLQFARLQAGARQALLLDVICSADPTTALDFRTAPSPAAAWGPVERNWVAVAGGRAEIDPSTLDHDAAVGVGWLVADGDWVTPREPGLAEAAWRGLRGHGLRGSAPRIRAEAARVLADAITTACAGPDGTPRLFLGTDRSWVRESSWMLALAPALPADPAVQTAAARAALELFRERAQVRPQEAIRDWASWAPRWEAVLGPDHPDTLAARNHLANVYQSAGDLAKAIPLYEQTVNAMQRVLVPYHASILTSRNNLAAAYQAAGRLEKAISMFEQTLAAMERAIGSEHPATLATRNNLAYAYQSAGDPGRAISLYERILRDRERVLGPDHSDTLTSRNSLASACQRAGDLPRAIPLYERALSDRERVLGPDHPDTLTSRNNLAFAYQEAGDLDRAIPLYEEALTTTEEVLGPDHPNTLMCRNNVAGAYRAAGNLTRAIPMFEQTLSDMDRALGPDHPNTLMCRINVADAYQATGDPHRAIRMIEQAVSDMERVLDVDHVDILTSRNRLAAAHQAVGSLEVAIPMFEQAVSDMERVLGSDHRATLEARNNLAGAYQAAGDIDQAIQLLEQNLTDKERVLGRDHPDTLGSRNNLAGGLLAAGDIDQAIHLLEQNLTDAKRVLGHEHPHTLTSRNSLAAAHRLAGDLDRAIPLFEQNLRDRERVLGPDHPHTVASRIAWRQALAVAGAPGSDDVALVDYWLSTDSWAEAFGVLDAMESRLRGPTAAAALTARAEEADPAAVQGMTILHAIQRLPRQLVYAIVADTRRALAATADAASAGQYDAVGLIRSLNPQAASHPDGLAILLTAMAAAEDPRLGQVALDLVQAGHAPAVRAALPRIAPLLRSEALQRAVPPVTTALSDSS